MKSITFTFTEQTTEHQRDEILERIRGLPGVRTAARLKPDATKQVLRRLAYAQVSDEDAARTIDTLRQSDGIEAAELPAERTLQSKRT